jgi:hypothetical protein
LDAAVLEEDWQTQIGERTESKWLDLALALRDGCVLCQLADTLIPGCVNWDAVDESDDETVSHAGSFFYVPTNSWGMLFVLY